MHCNIASCNAILLWEKVSYFAIPLFRVLLCPLQGGFEDRLLHFFIYGRSACWSLCCDNEFNLGTRKLLVYHFSLNTTATPYNFPILMWHAKMTRRFNYVIIIGALNVGSFV